MSRSGFLDRWAARKAAVRAAPAPDPAPAPDAPPGVAPDPEDDLPRLSEAEAAELTDAEALERLALPDPATLGHGADFAAFLRAGVPRRLQRLALRRLWRISPEQAALDGLVDYAEDYTDAAVAMGAVSTTYEVGKGLRAHSEALARERAEPGTEAEAESDVEAVGDAAAADGANPDGDGAELPEVESEAVEEEQVQIVAQQHEDRAAASRKSARRMVFRFDES